jgi:hypothetical protein
VGGSGLAVLDVFHQPVSEDGDVACGACAGLGLGGAGELEFLCLEPRFNHVKWRHCVCGAGVWGGGSEEGSVLEVLSVPQPSLHVLQASVNKGCEWCGWNICKQAGMQATTPPMPHFHPLFEGIQHGGSFVSVGALGRTPLCCAACRAEGKSCAACAVLWESDEKAVAHESITAFGCIPQHDHAHPPGTNHCRLRTQNRSLWEGRRGGGFSQHLVGSGTHTW